jgi:hypothetical protein
VFFRGVRGKTRDRARSAVTRQRFHEMAVINSEVRQLLSNRQEVRDVHEYRTDTL